MFSTLGDVQYTGGCSVHWGDIMSTVGGDTMSTPGDVQYSGGYHEYSGGYCEYTGKWYAEYTGGLP